MSSCKGGPVDHRIDRLDTAFVTAGSIVVELLEQPTVAGHWPRPSVLPKMSVGALACHLGRQLVRAAELLPLPTEALPLLSADDHYARAAWTATSSPDEPANDRSTDEAEAALGCPAARERAAGAQAKVRAQLTAGSPHVVISIPWQGWSLQRDDFLLTAC